ncbi:hypothetical protein BB560_004828, partial [Smittium megazygosporum]
MSTTDPSAAKPDGFAIGSISKRDRSGSGDEATPVYPTSLSLLSKFFENSQSQRREITCIRHLTMSTTDPSAAKPDGFAIGSISKRDRSGSGDEATPVYPTSLSLLSKFFENSQSQRREIT